jgi:hypothetical protein
MIQYGECIDFLQKTALEVLRPYVYSFLRRKLSEVVHVTTVIE